MILCYLFLVSEFRRRFTLCLFKIILVRFRLLSGHLFFFWGGGGGGEGRAAPSVDHMFSLYFDFVILVISRFGFVGGIWVLIAQVPGHYILVTFVKTFISHCSGGFRGSSELPKHIILYIYIWGGEL